MDDLKVFIQQEIMNLSFTKVGFDQSIITSKIVDSISAVELMVAIEEKIGKKIPQHLFTEEHFDTIEKICAMLATL